MNALVTIGKLAVIFLFAPYVFRKISFVVLKKIFLTTDNVKILCGSIWGIFAALFANYIVSGSGLIVAILGYLSGAYCAQLAYLENPEIMMSMKKANASSMLAYVTCVIITAALNFN